MEDANITALYFTENTKDISRKFDLPEDNIVFSLGRAEFDHIADIFMNNISPKLGYTALERGELNGPTAGNRPYVDAMLKKHYLILEKAVGNVEVLSPSEIMLYGLLGKDNLGNVNPKADLKGYLDRDF
jgi:hypothetical protein